MVKFSILPTGSSAKDLPYLIKELRKNNLIAGIEKDVSGDPIYITHNLVAVKKIIQEYDGLMLDICREK